MLNQIASAVEPIIISAAVVVLTALIGIIGDAIVHFINVKKAALIQKIGVDKYNSNLQVAREVWGVVDEHFRINAELTKTAETAAVKFQDEILRKIPGLTVDEIDHLRQAVAGEVNKGKAAVTTEAESKSEATSITTDVPITPVTITDTPQVAIPTVTV